MKTKSIKRLSKLSERLFNEYNDCAIEYGKTKLMVISSYTEEAEVRYKLARENLKKHLLQLENK